MNKAGPVVEKVIEENSELYLLFNKAAAAKRNAVELKSQFKLPPELMYLFGTRDGKAAEIRDLTCLHMFESSPQTKVAMAYSI